MKQTRTKALSLLLAISMLLAVLPAGLFGFAADNATSDPIYVLAGSDFQPTDGSNTTGVNLVNGILSQIQKDYSSMDGFLFAGDYDYNYQASAAGKAALQDAVQDVYGTGMHEVYVEGNHDDPSRSTNADLVSNGTLSPSGENDSDDYGVFVINHRDYMWKNDDEATIKETAASLEAYLSDKAEDDYTKPIFVVSHLPLHYCMRTKKEGDGMYANYIFDVLNAAGEEGLNIIFMFGHNHSHGWDDYLGGSAIYLAKGDKINIAQASKTSYKEETLNFTYMNAGYVSYYKDLNDGTEADLTMTVFEITSSQVIVKRYSSAGLHELKSTGVTNANAVTEYGSTYTEDYDPDTTVYPSPQYIKLVENNTQTSNGVTVSAPNITGLAVSVDKTNPNSELYSAYITYDITPNAYIQGDVAEVTITLPTDAGFDTSRPVVILDVSQNKTATKSIVDGKVHFTTQHFSEYAVMQLAESATFTGEWTAVSGSGYVYELDTNGIDTGVEYLIVANSYAKALSAAANSNNAVDITLSSDGTLAYADSDTYGWTFTRYNSSTTVYYIRLNGSTYLRLNNGSLASATNTGNDRRWTVSSNGNGSYDITMDITSSNSWRPTTTTYNLRWSDSNGVFQASSSNEGPVRLYKYKGEGEPTYAQLSGIVEHEIATNRYNSWTEVENMLRSYLTVMAGASDNSGTGASETNDYTFNGTVNPAVAGEYELEVVYEGVTLGTVTVNVVAKNVVSTTLISYNGTVVRGADDDVSTGAQILVVYDDETEELIDVTIGMLSGDDLDPDTVGTYRDLTVTYNGRELTNDFTLYVVTQNDKPAYPNDGAVRVNKTATGIDFQASGIARVELSTAGVNAKKGVDVVIVIDTSSSMDNALDGETPSGNEKSRIDILAESLEDMLLQFQKPNTTTGVVPDIDIAIISFNGFSTAIEGASVNGTNRNSNTDQSEVFTGETGLISDVGLSVDNFVSNTSLNAAQVAGQFNEDHTPSGTNYDAGLLNAYKLLSMKKEDNELNGESREQFLIFLSDGAPFRYNGFSHGTTGYDAWDQWLRGDWTDQEDFQDDYPDNDFAYFYNGNGSNHPHRVAEAIKGDPNQEYTVVLDRSAGAPYTAQYQGLGATIYSIGFGLAEDGDGVGTTKGSVTVDTMKNLMHVISSGEDYCVENVQSADELSSAFNQITGKIVNAATNARFVDQLGSGFDLVIKPQTYEVVVDGVETTKTHNPEITVKRYTLYTKADVEAGLVTADKVGQRTGAVETLEVISFTETGTEVYSTVLSGNILQNGIICANTFWYNTTSAGVAIDGVQIPQADGSISNVLPAETFYWKVGTVDETELAISYDVYLSGSMEGEKPAGSYTTNNYAILYYTNWLGNDIYQETTSPTVAWEAANVSYAFYLVNAKGEIVVDPSSGETGSFVNRVQVTRPVVYDEILLNNEDEIRAIQVADVANTILPEGYKLYDENAEYTIRINSNGTGEWAIVNGMNVATTYVTGFSGNAYSNSTEMEEVGYDYTHTIVWFAVLWIPSTIPDAVVIDFGLPVDIHVLYNDQFGDSGNLAGIAPAGSMPTTGVDNQGVVYTTALDTDFTTASITGKYGVLSIDVANKTVRYTLHTTNGMQMAMPETFEYAVYYTLPDGDHNGYYYGKITVIPATNVYYEESFVNLNNAKDANGNELTSNSGNGVWTQDGTAYEDANASQDEDRPGQFSPEDIDDDNLYGYDSAYDDSTTFSLGGAKKVTVDAATGSKSAAPSAKFTFTGTGFDVISLTNNDSGVITITAKNQSTGAVTRTSVNNYYGYTYNEETKEWVVGTDGADTIWQVPVIKMENLPYGTYDVEILIAYLPTADIVGDGSYSFWLDAIRIYNPAQGNKDAEEVYKQDNELNPQHMTLRDLIVDTIAAGSDTIEGVVFIDGLDGTNVVDLYANPGPNNETYLGEKQSIAFKLKANKKPDSVQLGVKLAYGASATLMLGDSEFVTVTTATDMYYDLGSKLVWTGDDESGYTSQALVLTNVTAGAVISITNIKYTGAIAVDGTVSGSQGSGNGTSNASTSVATSGGASDTEEVVTVAETAEATEIKLIAVIDAEVVAYAKQVMSELYAPAPDPFAPEHLDAEWGVGGVNKNSVLTITTSTDVASITVNGEEITSYVTFPVVQMKNWKLSVTWYKVWTYSVKVTEAGTYVYDVVAYNGEGLASEPITTELTLKSFTPEYLDTNWEAGRVNKKSVLTITTSTDVDYVTVNGEEIKSYVTVPVVQLNNWKLSVSWRKVWTYSVKVTEAGTSNYDVVAYDANGLASEPVSTVLTVRGR